MNLTAYFQTSYLPRLLAKGVAPATIADYEAVLRSAPAEPTCETVLTWLGAMHCPAATKNRKRRYLLAVLRDARKRGLVDAWVEDIPKAIEFATLPRAWRVDEFERLLTACGELHETYDGIPAVDWWRSFLLTMWYTGCRVQTLLATAGKDLDIAAATVVVSSTKDHRQILYSLPSDAVDAIRRIWWPRLAVWPWPFVDRKKTLLRRVRHLISLAELPQLLHPFHAIRRSVASYITARTGLAAACDYLDHCRAAVTSRYYVDPRIAVIPKYGGQSMPRPHLA